MARGLDSDYIGSLSIMDGFDMGITFDGFGENMKKFMELPIKYLDSAHDKAVELVEDIHSLIYAHSPDDKLPDKDHGTIMDPSTITRYPSTSVEMQQVNPNKEFSSSPLSLVTAEHRSLGSTATDVHETESVSSTSPAMCADTKEEVTFCNAEDLSDNCTPENHNSLGRSFSSEEEVILWTPWNSVTPPQSPEQATVVQDYVSEEANGNKIIEQVELHGSGHSESSAFDGAILLGKGNGEEQSELCSANSHEESTKHGNIKDLSVGTVSHYLSAEMFSSADDPNTSADETTDFVNIDLGDGQEQMKYNKAETSSFPQPKNTSFKNTLLPNTALAFLHSINIVHMDLKPENILLDDKMIPKIADFGLSRLFGQEQTRMKTQNVVGSYGYIAPEYLYRGEISTKSDIYSLGLLILETTTVQKNCSNNEPSAMQFIKSVRDNWTDEHIVSQCSRLDGDRLQQIKKCIEIGLECVEIDRQKRPSIEKIVDRLNGLWSTRS